MPKKYFIINNKNDYELTSVALWFALTYLYSINIDVNEKRYLKCKTCNRRVNIIRNCSDSQICSWIDYALIYYKKNVHNSGNVSYLEQINFARLLSQKNTIIK